jgi:hypothetical protein
LEEANSTRRRLSPPLLVPADDRDGKTAGPRPKVLRPRPRARAQDQGAAAGASPEQAERAAPKAWSPLRFRAAFSPDRICRRPRDARHAAARSDAPALECSVESQGSVEALLLSARRIARNHPADDDTQNRPCNRGRQPHLDNCERRGRCIADPAYDQPTMPRQLQERCPATANRPNGGRPGSVDQALFTVPVCAGSKIAQQPPGLSSPAP